MRTDPLTDLQLAVMKALWKVGSGSVGDIHAAMSEDGRALAPTTVATLLQRLSKQGWVAHKKSGRQFVYRAKVEQQEAAQGALQRLLRSFFGGKVSALTAQLMESEQLSPDDVAALRELVKNREG
jgi:predicted transcriptional regulator